MPKRLLSTDRITEMAHKFTNEAVVRTLNWIVTDHSGLGQALNRMPDLDFIDSLLYILTQFIITIIAIFIGGILLFAMVAFGIPLLFDFLL